MRAFATGPVLIIAAHDGENIRPALLLSTDMISKFQQTPDMIRKYEEAHIRLRENRRDIEREEQVAAMKVGKADMRYEEAIREIDRLPKWTDTGAE